jgi:hypothetical protein
MKNSWVSATLGYVPGYIDSKEVECDVSVMSQEEIVQYQMSKVTVIKAEIMRGLSDGHGADPDTVQRLREQLHGFYRELPNWMLLDHLLEEQGMQDVPLRRAIFYVHLFHLSALMLFSRRLIATMTMSRGPREEAGSGKVPDPIRFGILDGVLAAKTAARVLDLMKDEDTVIRICWLCM